MLSLVDPRWAQMKGGYRVAFDPRPLFAKLEVGNHDEEIWHTLWNELHHQGDVDEASYASVPHLVRIYRQRSAIDWNTYAIVGTIELARGERKNPELPTWLKDGYFEAIRDLAETGVKQLPDTEDQYALRGILSVVALHKGVRIYARVLLEYSEAELLDIELAASEVG